MNIFNIRKKCVTIMLCSACNTKCKHCYISYCGNRKKDEVKEMITNLKNQGFEVILNGSEPLIFDGFLELFKMTGQEQIFSNSKVILEHPEILQKLKENNIKQISYSYHYGMQEKWSEVSLKDVEKAIELTKMAGIKVCLLCSLCTENYKKVAEICDVAHKLGASELHLGNFILQGNAKLNKMDNLILNEEQILEVLTEINKARQVYDRNELYISRCGSFGNIIGSKNYFCDAGINDLVLTPNNKVYPCIFLAGVEGFEIGEYKDGKLILNKTCKFDCNDCFVKKILNYKENLNLINPLEK